ncbi:hypothetical protein AAVH_07206 [Aphelenchoides avenae]|nr:hypothetical protein AAVH_07206 [Aphelenchus avenae]
MFLTSIVLELSAISCILTLTTLATLRTLDRQRQKMSVKARYMQSQLNRLMFAEVFSLMSVFVIPFFFVMAFLIFDVKLVGLGVLIALVAEWIPAVNPVRERPGSWF